ncbi:speriolin-like protein [Hippoglossus hippoglossus]|uniref:speriolin-like protein n=1 Tax=Hippoglossus hippoglossus TaxID=8267 RepID=UPI00148E76AD|nr:speriolin-like protein [Hippoglossus hippoglossus]
MDLEQTVTVLLSENEQLGHENQLLKLLFSVVKENSELRARIQSFNIDTLGSSTGRKPTSLWKTTLDESQFRKNLNQTSLPHERRTLSPNHFRSFMPNTAHTDIHEKAESHSCQADVALDGKDETLGEIALRMLGEIALQLDRRILSFVFQGHRRFYGFTVQNIPVKIIDVSTNRLTGKMDEGYQLYLTQRYADLIEQLNQLGYKKALHPPFSEFIVNTYGILKKRPGKHGPQSLDYNNPETLKKLIMTTAPIKLQENLLLLLRCLCNMADKDRRPLIL